MENFFYNIWKKIEFDLKYLFSTLQFWISALFFMMLAFILVTIFIPMWTGFGIMFGLAVNIPLLLLLGGSSYQWKRSTLIKNQSLTKMNNTSYNLSTIFFILIVGNLLALFFFIVLALVGEAGVILSGWLASSYLDVLNWNQVSWLAGIPVIEVNFILVFAIYFAIYRFVENIKNYYIAVLILSVLYIIFGAALNNFLSGTYYSNEDGTLYYFKFKAMMFPKEMFIPSLLFPFYGVSQLQTVIFGYQLGGHFGLGVDAGYGTPLVQGALPIWFAQATWQYIAIWLQAIVWILILYAVGMIAHKIKKG